VSARGGGKDCVHPRGCQRNALTQPKGPRSGGVVASSKKVRLRGVSAVAVRGARVALGDGALDGEPWRDNPGAGQ